jgi:hypothetical protein
MTREQFLKDGRCYYCSDVDVSKTQTVSPNVIL